MVYNKGDNILKWRKKEFVWYSSANCPKYDSDRSSSKWQIDEVYSKKKLAK